MVVFDGGSCLQWQRRHSMDARMAKCDAAIRWRRQSGRCRHNNQIEVAAGSDWRRVRVLRGSGVSDATAIVSTSCADVQETQQNKNNGPLRELNPGPRPWVYDPRSNQLSCECYSKSGWNNTVHFLCCCTRDTTEQK